MLSFLTKEDSTSSENLADTLTNQFYKVLGKRFPNFKDLIEKNIADPRDMRGRRYSLTDLIGSTVSSFVLQQGSRHSYNQDRSAMADNFERLLGVKLAYGDTCEDLLREVDPMQTGALLTDMVSTLLESKVFSPFRLQGKYLVAIDATGLHRFSDDQQGTALSKTSKNNTVSYSSAVLEAKLVGANGFAISLCQEWISNEYSSLSKQDCEQTAFLRLAEKLKHHYRRLPIIILGDALYRLTIKSWGENL